MRGTLSADACMIACTIKQDDDGPWSIRSMGVIRPVVCRLNPPCGRHTRWLAPRAWIRLDRRASK